ncbi:arsenate reductase/protein-tyrosine-phosphatase family protein [Aquimarina rhabdastrellae]
MNNILFICSANKQRSKTADDYFSSRYVDQFLFDSAGTNLKICHKEGTNPLTEELVKWADLILVMEKRHKKLINSQTKEKYDFKIKVLNIPDRFKYYQKELIQLLEEKVIPYLENF